MGWARVLAYITGTVDQELLLRNEYLAAENRILRSQLKGRLLLSDPQRATLGEIGHRLGHQALAEAANAKETRDHPEVVPAPSRPQVRWIQAATLPRSPASGART